MIRKVLLVDDDHDLREIIAEYLEGNGYKVIQATNGADALKTLTHEGPSFVALVTDNDMPSLPGEGLIQALASSGIELPLKVLISGRALTEAKVQEMGFKYGTCVLSKPFDHSELLRILDEFEVASS